MNLGQMETALQRYGFDGTDPLAIWINAAMHEVEAAFDWPFLEEGPVTIQAQPVALGQPCFVTLPADCLKIITLFDSDHKANLLYWNRRKFRRMIQDQSDVGLMEVYTLVNTNTLQVWRCPTLTTNLELVYQATTPDLVNSTDTPSTGSYTWSSILHYPIVMRAASIALQAENEEDRAKTAQQEYERSLLACMAKFGERELGDVETVEDVQGYGGDMSLRGMAGY